MITITAEIAALIARNALFVCNHSGGKDSQIMLIEMLKVIPRDQIIVLHASLGDIEWPGALEHAQQQAEAAGVPFHVVKAAKSFTDMVERRFEARPSVPSFPSPSTRQCTSDLKRAPIVKFLNNYSKDNNRKLIVSCMGLRAQESSARAKREGFKFDTNNSKAGRECYEWNPVHTMLIEDVWAGIADAGQKPHPAYALGNDRLSCVFCIMGSKNDIALGAKHNPALFARFVALEEKTGYTMHASRKSLTQLVEEARFEALTIVNVAHEI